jgi:hypothetical protein
LSFVSVSSLLLYYVFPLRILTLNIYYNVVEQLLTLKSAWSLSFVKTKIKWKVIRTKKKSLWNEETKLVYGMKEIRNLSKNYLLLLMTTFITTTNTWSHLLKTSGKKKLILMERSDLIQLTFKLAVYAPHENSFRKSQISLAFQDILYYYFYCLLSLHYLQCYKYFFKSINLLLFFCAIPHGSVTMSTKTMKAPHLQKRNLYNFY